MVTDFAIEFYAKPRTVSLLEAYDAGIERSFKLITGTYCSVTRKGQCAVCAVGAIFMGAHPKEKLPTTQREAEILEDKTGVWVDSVREGLPHIEGEGVLVESGASASPTRRILTEIIEFNDSDAGTKARIAVSNWEPDKFDREEGEDGFTNRYVASKDKVRRFIIENDYAGVQIPVAKKITV